MDTTLRKTWPFQGYPDTKSYTDKGNAPRENIKLLEAFLLKT